MVNDVGGHIMVHHTFHVVFKALPVLINIPDINCWLKSSANWLVDSFMAFQFARDHRGMLWGGRLFTNAWR